MPAEDIHEPDPGDNPPPETAMAHLVSRAAVHGSPKLRRRARMVVFAVLALPGLAVLAYVAGELL